MGSKGDLFHILRLVEENKLRPILDTTLALKDARFGHERISERAHFGKIVLVP
jgi:NADPH:quinone reductase-like Zn-dependent oxidoreductase